MLFNEADAVAADRIAGASTNCWRAASSAAA